MTEILLEQLNADDILWLRQIGSQQRIEADAVLVQEQNQIDYLYIVLSGELVATVSTGGGALGRAFAALEEDEQLEQEITHFGAGEVLGEMSFLDIHYATSTIKAVETTIVLAIPKNTLQAKIAEDLGFAARYMKAIALLLSYRFDRIVKVFLRQKMGQIAPLQDVPVLFGELKDSDVDWMLRSGQVQAIRSGTVLIQTGRKVENLYIMLRGKMSLMVSEPSTNPLIDVFAALETETSTAIATPQREIIQVVRGEIIGEMAAFDAYVANETIEAVTDSLVLAIARWQLIAKLQQDVGMAARFYRVVAILLSGRIESLISRLGFGKSSYRMGERLSDEVEYEDEIDLDLMDNLTLGGARFDWMLRRLQVS